jgi:hypothetical protein
MAKIRKRRPGGGRKPVGPISGKTSNFSTRISAETRSAIDTEASALGQSISQVAERLLQIGIREIRESQTVSHTRALRFLVGQLADNCSIKPGDTRFEWNQDAFLFDAFRVALNLLLDYLRPKQSSVKTQVAKQKDLHAVWLEILDTPKELGKNVFLHLWEDLHRVQPMSAGQFKSKFSNFGADDATAAAWERYSYTLDNVRRDLGIGGKS